MRVYEIVLRSGARTEVTAEVCQDDASHDDKVYFYRDTAKRHLVAYFLREEIAGIILGPDNVRLMPRYK